MIKLTRKELVILRDCLSIDIAERKKQNIPLLFKEMEDDINGYREKLSNRITRYINKMG